MRSLLLSILLTSLFACQNSIHEPTIPQTPTVLKYIQQQGVYVPLTDSSSSKKLLVDSYNEILEYMRKHNLNVNNYFLLDGEFTVSQDANYMMIPLRHYSSLKLEMEKGNDMSEVIKEQKVSKNGNLSGKDGFIIIKYPTNEVTTFQLWQ